MTTGDHSPAELTLLAPTQASRVFVSGCINGSPVRYNQTNVELRSPIWDRWKAEGRIVTMCPELASGFQVPRPPAEIVGGTARNVFEGRAVVREDNGRDVTGQFLEGARLAVERALATGCVAALLTDGSPSCGTTYQYDGSFDGGTIPGRGVVAELFVKRGIPVFPEAQIEQVDALLRAADAEEDG